MQESQINANNTRPLAREVTDPVKKSEYLATVTNWAYAQELPESVSQFFNKVTQNRRMGMIIEDKGERYSFAEKPGGFQEVSLGEAFGNKTMYVQKNVEAELILQIKNPQEFLQKLAVVQEAMGKNGGKWGGYFSIISIWDNATPYDFAHPLEFLNGLEYGLEHDQFAGIKEWTIVGNSEQAKKNLLVRNTLAERESEAPYDLLVALGDTDTSDRIDYPSIHYVQESPDTARIYALQMPAIEGRKTEGLVRQDYEQAKMDAQEWQTYFLELYKENKTLYEKVLGPIPPELLQMQKENDSEEFVKQYADHITKNLEAQGKTVWDYADDKRIRSHEEFQYIHYRLSDLVGVGEKLNQDKSLLEKYSERRHNMSQYNKLIGKGTGSPPQVLSLTAAIAAFHAKGIRNIRIPINIPGRRHEGVEGKKIDARIADQLKGASERISKQIQGVSVISSDGDFIELRLEDVLSSKENPFLQELLHSYGNLPASETKSREMPLEEPLSHTDYDPFTDGKNTPAALTFTVDIAPQTKYAFRAVTPETPYYPVRVNQILRSNENQTDETVSKKQVICSSADEIIHINAQGVVEQVTKEGKKKLGRIDTTRPARLRSGQPFQATLLSIDGNGQTTEFTSNAPIDERYIYSWEMNDDLSVSTSDILDRYSKGKTFGKDLRKDALPGYTKKETNLDSKAAEILSPKLIHEVTLGVHPLYMANYPILNQLSVEQRGVYDEARQRLYNSSLEFVPTQNDQLLLFMPIYYSSGENNSPDWQNNMAAIRYTKLLHPDYKQWADLYEVMQAQAGEHKENIILSPDIVFTDAQAADLLQVIKDKGYVLAEGVKFKVIGELLDDCVKSAVLQLMTLSEIKTLDIDTKAVLTGDYQYGNDRQDVKKFIKMMQWEGFVVTEENRIITVTKTQPAYENI